MSQQETRGRCHACDVNYGGKCGEGGAPRKRKGWGLYKQRRGRAEERSKNIHAYTTTSRRFLHNDVCLLVYTEKRAVQHVTLLKTSSKLLRLLLTSTRLMALPSPLSPSFSQLLWTSSRPR